MVEHDEYVGFIVGYTSNGVPYGLSHEEWDKINPETNKKPILPIYLSDRLSSTVTNNLK